MAVRVRVRVRVRRGGPRTYGGSAFVGWGMTLLPLRHEEAAQLGEEVTLGLGG